MGRIHVTNKLERKGLDELLNKLIVQKYGGTSVGTLERIARVAEHIRRTFQAGKQLVVVVSAMGQQTDELLEMAYSLHASPPKRELDMLVTTGERISMALLSIALARLDIPSISLTGSQSGILTDENHGNARIRSILGDRIRRALLEKKVVIVAGFQGMSPQTKDITSLGRGGSDLTAIALAVALQAQSCQIYTDVDGVLTADPRLVPQARLIPQLSWEETVELAWAGAGVLHHRGAYVAAKFRLPVEIRSSLDFSRSGTLIEGILAMERPCVRAISHKKSQSLNVFGLQPAPKAPSAASLCLNWLWQQDESPAVIQQHQNDRKEQEVLVLLSEHLADPLHRYLASFQDGTRKELRHISRRDGLAIVSLVGQGFRQSPELVAEVWEALSLVEVLYGEAKDNLLSFVIPEQDLKSSLNILHDRFVANAQAVV